MQWMINFKSHLVIGEGFWLVLLGACLINSVLFSQIVEIC